MAAKDGNLDAQLGSGVDHQCPLGDGYGAAVNSQVDKFGHERVTFSIREDLGQVDFTVRKSEGGN